MKTNFSTFNPVGKSLVGFGQLFKTAFVLMAVLFSGILAEAQTSATGRFLTYDFSPIASGTTFNTYPSRYANTTYIDSAGTTISRGSGLRVNTAAAGAWAFDGCNASTEAGAISGNDYVQFPVVPKAGCEVRLDSVVLRWRFSVANINVIHSVRTSTDGYRKTLGTTTTQSNATANANNTTIIVLNKPLYETDTFFVRIYIAGPSGGGTAGRIYRLTDGTTNNSFNDDISLRGRVSTTIPLMQAFDFSTSANGTEATVAPSSVNTTYISSTGVTISRGSGVTTTTNRASTYGVGGINTANQANAISGNEYVEFKLVPNAGYEYSLDRILVRYRQTTTGTGYALRSSQNNYASNISSGTFLATANVDTTEFIPLFGAGQTTLANLASDSSITFRLYLWGTTTARSFYFGDGNATVNDDIEFYGDMTTATIPQTTLSAAGSTTTCLGGGIQLNVTTLGGTAPFSVVLLDNLGQTRTHRQVTGGEPITIYPQSNRTYTIQSVTDTMGHTATIKNGSVSVTVTSSPVSSDTAVRGRTLNHLDGYTLTYADSTGTLCRSYATIADAAGGTNPGSTRVTATVLNFIPVNSTSRYFISRNVRVQPTTNGNATVTLFFTQAEFTAFNTAALYHQKLPTTPSDTVGVQSKLLVRRTQSSTETDSLTTFTPTSVTWNATNSQWEVTIAVNDAVLGGSYYVSTPFNTSKLVGTISHTAVTPVAGNTTASVTVDWPDVTGVGTMQYRFRFRPVGSSVWNASTITGSQRTMNFLSFNTSYEVQIRVFESGLGQFTQGEYSKTYTFTTPAEPAKLPDCFAPTGNVTLNSPVSATISWASVANGANYIVEMRALNSLVWGGTSTTGNSVTFNALTPGATYEYRLRTTCISGYTATGTSPFSSVGTFTTAAISPCGVVGNLTTVSTTANSATVSWNPVGFATSYQVEVRLKNTAIWGGSSTTSTSVTFNNLSSGSNYEYRVRAYCNNAPVVTSTTIGLFSNIAEFTTASTPALGICLPPTNIIATPTANSVTVTWDSASYASGYFINIKQANAASWGGNVVNGLTRTFNALSPSTNYQIRIRTSCTPGTTTSNNSVFSDTVLFATTALANKAIFGTDEMPSYNVYPNPTRDNLHIDFTSPSTETVRIDVRDMTGRLIQTQRIDPMVGANSFDVDLKSAADGLYLIHIYQGSALRFMNKIQKTH